MTKIVNSAAGNSVFRVTDGAAITDSTQPALAGGSMIAGGTNSQLDGVSAVNTILPGTDVVADTHMAKVDTELAMPVTNQDNNRTKVRTVKVTAAIRAGKLNPSDNSWDASYPQTADDTSALSLTSDDTTNIVYGDGIGAPTSAET